MRRNVEDHGSGTAEDKKIPEDSRDKNTKGASVFKVFYLTISLESTEPCAFWFNSRRPVDGVSVF